ncbi:MAG: low specificity L-threonine aldolase [Desulfuromonadia bacterium]
MATPGNQFASDNYAGICPEALRAMVEANTGTTTSYGDDPWTDQACSLIRQLFETDCEVFFVFTGTAANSLALASLCHSYHSIICHSRSHIETDECGAPEFFSNGTKILLVEGEGGKVDPRQVRETVHRRSDIHYPKPKVLSITQATEMGTVYTPDEVGALGELAHSLGLRLHMDGARFANAVAHLECTPADISWRAGVDVLCFGGAKNGMAVGEAVIFFNRELACEFDYRCKQAGQLASKMRFLSSPWIGLLKSGTWLENARHANRCAERLAAGLAAIPGVTLMNQCEANGVFVRIPDQALDRLRGMGWHFYTFIGTGGARFMCSWQTTDDDVDLLIRDVASVMGEFNDRCDGPPSP